MNPVYAQIATLVPVELCVDLGHSVVHVTAAIDLVYFEPVSGALVVALWTLHGDEAEARAATAEAERAEARRLARALRDALGQTSVPRCELWYVDTGEIVPCDA